MPFLFCPKIFVLMTPLKESTTSAPYQNKPAVMSKILWVYIDTMNLIGKVSTTPHYICSDQSIKPLLKPPINQFALLLFSNWVSQMKQYINFNPFLFNESFPFTLQNHFSHLVLTLFMLILLIIKIIKSVLNRHPSLSRPLRLYGLIIVGVL